LRFVYRQKLSICWIVVLLRREPFDLPRALHLSAFLSLLSFHLFVLCSQSSAERLLFDSSFLQTACFVSSDLAMMFYPCDSMSDFETEITWKDFIHRSSTNKSLLLFSPVDCPNNHDRENFYCYLIPYLHYLNFPRD
jgi:hypothetical protein